jgi:hypothetical protein
VALARELPAHEPQPTRAADARNAGATYLLWSRRVRLGGTVRYSRQLASSCETLTFFLCVCARAPAKGQTANVTVTN